MTGIDVLNKYLTSSEINNFKETLLELNKKEYNRLLTKQDWSDNPQSLISLAFHWDITEQGNDYWYNLFLWVLHKNQHTEDKENPLEQLRIVKKHTL